MNQAVRQTISSTSEDESAAESERAANIGDEPSAGLLERALNRARAQIRERPLQVVGGAFAVGFVIGNGLPRFVGRTAVVLGLRMLLARALFGGGGEARA